MQNADLYNYFQPSKKKKNRTNETIAVHFPVSHVFPRGFSNIVKKTSDNDLPNAPTGSKMLSENLLHLKTGVGCPVVKGLQTEKKNTS